MPAERPSRALGSRHAPSGHQHGFAHHPARLLRLDADGLIVSASRPLAGHSVRALTGRPLASFVRGAQGALLAATIRDVASLGVERSMTLPITGPGESWHLATLGREGDGVLAVLVDITRQHNEQERLRRSESLLQDAQGTARLGTWEWDVTQPHAVWSPELYNIYGLDPTTHTPTYQDYLTRVHPEDRERVEEATARVFHEHASYAHDERVRRSDGEWRHLRTWAHPVLDGHGDLVRLVGVCQDITEQRVQERELRSSQDRLAAIVDQSPMGIASLDEGGRFQDANAALGRMLGQDAGSIAGQRVHDLIVGRAPEEADAWLTAARQGDAVLACHTRASPPRELEATLRFIGGDPGLHVLVVEDVTEHRKSLEADRLALVRLLEVKHLESKARLRQRMMRIAGHELKNPLSPLLLQLHMLKEGKRGPLTPDQGRSMEAMYGQMQRMQRLIEDLLDSARLEGEGAGLEKTDVDAVAIADRAVQTYAETARQWGVDLALDAPPEPVVLQADAQRAEQVLVNLLANALKFTPRGGHVRVQVREEVDAVVWDVVDDGPGIEPDEQQSVFEAFAQASGPKGREHGSGLGLFIARDIVAAHGGSIRVRSAPGEGAAFEVRLPRGPKPSLPPSND